MEVMEGWSFSLSAHVDIESLSVGSSVLRCQSPSFHTAVLESSPAGNPALQGSSLQHWTLVAHSGPSDNYLLIVLKSKYTNS